MTLNKFGNHLSGVMTLDKFGKHIHGHIVTKHLKKTNVMQTQDVIQKDVKDVKQKHDSIQDEINTVKNELSQIRETFSQHWILTLSGDGRYRVDHERYLINNKGNKLSYDNKLYHGTITHVESVGNAALYINGKMYNVNSIHQLQKGDVFYVTLADTTKDHSAFYIEIYIECKNEQH